MRIFDLFKTIIYDFYYNFIIKKKYGNRVCLMYTNTDSLILAIETEGFY